MQPEQQQLHLRCTTTGRVNAVAFWFELQLEEEQTPTADELGGGGTPSSRLSTGPFSRDSGGQTWKVAVQPLGAAGLGVEEGAAVSMRAQHDTYAISFVDLQRGSPSSSKTAAAPEQANGLPAAEFIAASGADPVWLARCTALQALNREVGKSAAQDPLVYRRLARAALAIAARPGDHGLDAAAAAQMASLASRLCG